MIQEIWALVNEMSPYLLLGFGFAGLLHAFVPTAMYRRYLGGNDFRSVLWAALIGVPLPLCSCGVIPTAMSLRKEGASKGATTSFLIATPQTGVDSILATGSLLGLPFAILRPVAALVTALLGGVAVNRWGGEHDAAQGQPAPADGEDLPTADGAACCASSSGTACQPEPQVEKMTFGQRCIEALRYGYYDMIQDIGRWLVLGLVVAGLITVLVPDDFFLRFADIPVLSMLVVLAISIPMYVCATGSIPIAVALMLKGITPGAALVLLMAGPASNMASILVIRKVLGRRTLWVYLLSITLGAIVFGLAVDILLPREWFTSHLVMTHACCHHGPALFNVVCSVVLTALLVFALVMRYVPAKSGSVVAKAGSVAAKRQYKVGGMMCNHCRANVEKAISQVPGVTSAEVDLASGIAIVEGTATDEAVIQAVTSIGYTAEVGNV